MFYGDIVDILPSGLRVRDKSLQTIGTYDRSRSWGVWVPQEDDEGDVITSPAGATGGLRQLIVSPFHPLSWPFLVRMELKISAKPGSLAQAASFLRARDLNILYAQCALSGSNHATWNVIAEATAIRKEMQRNVEGLNFDFPGPRSKFGANAKAYELAFEVSNLIADKMFRVAGEVWEALNPKSIPDVEASATENSQLFLHNRIWSRKQHLYEEGKIKSKVAYRQMSVQLPRPTKVRWLENLAYFALFGGGSGVPLEFIYERSSSLLKLLTPCELEFTTLPGRKQPSLAIGSYDAFEHYCRLYPIHASVLRTSVSKVRFRYRSAETVAEQRSSSGSGLASTQGLLESLAEILKGSNVDLLRVANKITAYDGRVESGDIEFLAHHLDKSMTIEDARAHLESRMLEAQLPILLQEREATVSPLERLSVFASMRFGHPRHDSLRSLLLEAGEINGLAVRVSKTHTGRATESVRKKIEETFGFVQLLMLRPDETAEDFRRMWMDFEYGLAVGMSKPKIRLVDVSRCSHETWHQIIEIDRDRSVRPFRLDVGDDELRESLVDALAELAAAIKNR